MSRRISRAARRYLLTGQPESEAYAFGHSGGRWALHTKHLGDMSFVTVLHFRDAAERRAWMGRRPHVQAVGKRNPWVRAFRRTMFPDCRAARVSRADVFTVLRAPSFCGCTLGEQCSDCTGGPRW